MQSYAIIASNSAKVFGLTYLLSLLAAHVYAGDDSVTSGDIQPPLTSKKSTLHPSPAAIQAAPVPSALSIAQTISANMENSEGLAHGTEDWPWSSSGRVLNSAPPSGWTSGIGWGTLYRDASDSRDTNTRIALRNFKIYMLSKATGKWTLVSPAGFTGAHWAENFGGNVNIPAAFRTEADGSISDKLPHGYNLHYFSNSRFTVNPNDYLAVFASVDARLIMDNPKGVDDRNIAKYLFNVGGDWWKSMSAGYCGLNCNNTEIGYSKFKYITTNWQTLTFTTSTYQQLLQHPLPL